VRYVFALLLALLGGCYQYTPYQPQDNDSPGWYHWLTTGTHQVYTNCGENGTSSGSGVVVYRSEEDTYLATAAHVTDLGCTYTVDGVELELVAYDEYYDQAILKGYIAGRVTDEVDQVFIGQKVITVGYPYQPFTGMTGLQITHGTLSAFVGPRYKTTAMAYYGNSGGPCFDKHGDLIGLVVSMRVAYPYEWYVTPSWRTYELLAEALE
jgi:S1-C subfamily serine protease